MMFSIFSSEQVPCQNEKANWGISYYKIEVGKLLINKIKCMNKENPLILILWIIQCKFYFILMPGNT